MNRTEAAGVLKHIDSVKAYAEGKVIELWSESHKEWTEVDKPLFCKSLKYRVRPEPREFWIISNSKGRPLTVVRTKEQAQALVLRFPSEEFLVVKTVEETL